MSKRNLKPLMLMLSAAVYSVPAWAQQSVDPLLPVIRVKSHSLFDPVDGRGANDAQMGVKVQGYRSGGISKPQGGDAAGLLKEMPGISTYGAGGVSSLPVVRGLADERLRLQVDDMDLMAACANHMNPALSYVDSSRVDSIRVYAGITPVSVGGDSIGGTIQVESAAPEFVAPGEAARTGGRLRASYRSNGKGVAANASAFLAGEQFNLNYEGAYARSDNYRAGGDFKPVEPGREQGEPIAADRVGSTHYRSQNHVLGTAWRQGQHLFQADLGWQNIPLQAFPNQRMDMTANRATLVNLRYTGHYRWGNIKARYWHQRIRHEMDMGEDRYSYGTGMPMRTRAVTRGASLQANWVPSDREIMRFGIELLRYTLYDWWPPVGESGAMAPDVFWNIDYGRRNKAGVYAEWERHWDARWMTVMGVRHTRVMTDAAAVQGYSTLPTWSDDAAQFNALERKRQDRHWDISLMAEYKATAGRRYEMGVARQTRSPSLYQRYPWSTNTMAAGMNNYLGDGNGYLGNPDLKPETAYTLSLSGIWEDPADEDKWRLQVSAYATHISDYIDAERCAASRCRSGNQQARDEFVLLNHVNQDARMFGFDVSGERRLVERSGWGRVTLSGSFNWLHGRNMTTDDGLYNIMPPNLKLGLKQQLPVSGGVWTGALEWEGARPKNRRSAVRNEIRTAGYGLLHLRGHYEIGAFGFDVGIENLLDKHYSLPLGGVYIGQGSSMMLNTVPWGIAVPGRGRSIYAGFSYKF